MSVTPSHLVTNQMPHVSFLNIGARISCLRAIFASLAVMRENGYA
jgi:hypothetical protein